jgi:hypothetical protein
MASRDAELRAVDQAKAACGRADGLVEDAERHADAVAIALASARDGREARLREAIQGGDVIEAATSRREARFAEIDAADELEAARKVLTSCMAALADAHRLSPFWPGRVFPAAHARPREGRGLRRRGVVFVGCVDCLDRYSASQHQGFDGLLPQMARFGLNVREFVLEALMVAHSNQRRLFPCAQHLHVRGDRRKFVDQAFELQKFRCHEAAVTKERAPQF